MASQPSCTPSTAFLGIATAVENWRRDTEWGKVCHGAVLLCRQKGRRSTWDVLTDHLWVGEPWGHFTVFFIVYAACPFFFFFYNKRGFLSPKNQ